MAGFIFTISILSILTTVGFLFAWMVKLASIPESSRPKQDLDQMATVSQESAPPSKPLR